MNAIHFETDGPYCDLCTEKIETTLGEMAGVSLVRSNYTHGLTTVLYDGSVVDIAHIAAAINDCGFAARPAPWYGMGSTGLHNGALQTSVGRSR